MLLAQGSRDGAVEIKHLYCEFLTFGAHLRFPTVLSFSARWLLFFLYWHPPLNVRGVHGLIKFRKMLTIMWTTLPRAIKTRGVDWGGC